MIYLGASHPSNGYLTYTDIAPTYFHKHERKCGIVQGYARSLGSPSGAMLGEVMNQYKSSLARGISIHSSHRYTRLLNLRDSNRPSARFLQPRVVCTNHRHDRTLFLRRHFRHRIRTTTRLPLFLSRRPHRRHWPRSRYHTSRQQHRCCELCRRLRSLGRS